ncbi:hypothetical protein BCR37DRAFT_390192 [Protomyces lactucae-debilis]|uniref:Ribosome biogenesis protein NSA1 n=1 Tax=Protomyces lactucae-debilis TaxID=2754530 RepID=A0A1Y2FUM0_PROLT|nr:uncharacterized protein BCR37DRAFT_390192 [Protomyces lactucae-debilis]ORY87659.1 hypothetical protein BCR37DRAFT_390192 [Protomyces lactucae-debilis]
MRFLVADSHGKLSRVAATKDCNAMVKDAPLPDITLLSGPTDGKHGVRIQRMCLIDEFEGSRCVAVVSGSFCDDTAGIEILKVETGETCLNLSLEHDTVEGSRSDHGRAKQTEHQRAQGDEEESCVALVYALGILCLCTTAGRLWAFDLSSKAQTVPRFNYSLPAPIGAFCAHPRLPGLFAFGGKENDLQVWKTDAQEGHAWTSMKPFWKAKNVKNDHLDLRVPVWISGIAFLPSQAESPKALKLVTSTMYGQLRVYTTDKARRPVHQVEPGEYAIQAMLHVTEDEVIVRDTHANVMHVSLANTTSHAKVLGTYKGFSSSVSSVDTADGWVVAGSLNGYVRVYDLQKHTCQATVYLDDSRKVVQVLFLDHLEVQEVKEEEDEEEEDVWDGIEEVESEQRRKRVKR